MKKLTILLIAFALSGCASVYGREGYTALSGKNPAQFEHDMKQCKRKMWLETANAIGGQHTSFTIPRCMEAKGWCHLC
ncbi:MAG: hypothetical protein ACR2P4_09135 [Gammaproteobacteria bacterium]